MAQGSRTTSRSRTSATEALTASGKERMVHIRVSPELHRKLRLIVAANDTSLQDWIAQTLENAVEQAQPDPKAEDAS